MRAVAAAGAPKRVVSGEKALEMEIAVLLKGV